MPKKILAPHRVQDGWVYWRIKTTPAASAANAPTINPLWLVKKDTLECVKASDLGLGVGYSDDTPGSRIISSRRVEEAVETADFLKLCAEEGLSAMLQGGYWFVANNWSRGGYRMGHDHEAHYVYFHKTQRDDGDGHSDDFIPAFAGGRTLREAYYRYKAAAGDAE